MAVACWGINSHRPVNAFEDRVIARDLVIARDQECMITADKRG